jgi:hypothetical protein
MARIKTSVGVPYVSGHGQVGAEPDTDTGIFGDFKFDEMSDNTKLMLAGGAILFLIMIMKKKKARRASESARMSAPAPVSAPAPSSSMPQIIKVM